MTNAELEEVICELHKRIALTTAGTPLQDDLIKAVGALRIAVNRIAELEARLTKDGEWRWNSLLNEYEWVDTTIYCPYCGARMEGEQE